MIIVIVVIAVVICHLVLKSLYRRNFKRGWRWSERTFPSTPPISERELDERARGSWREFIGR